MDGTATLVRTEAERVTVDAPPLPSCGGCGATLAPSGACLEIGACREADGAAARRSIVGATSKAAAAPSAWNARGGVD